LLASPPPIGNTTPNTGAFTTLTTTVPLAQTSGGTGVSNASLTSIIATGSTTARTLGTRFADVVNVKDFGAVGDGVTDDTAAIKAAINYAVPGATVYFPKGNYLITSTVSISASSGIGGVILLGEGQGSQITASSAVTSLFSFAGDLCSVQGLNFNGGSTTNAKAIVFNGGVNNYVVSLSGCLFSSFSVAVDLHTDSWIVNNNYFVNCTTAINLADSALNGSCYSNYTLGGQTSVNFTQVTQQAEGVRVFNNTFLNTAANAKAINILAGLEIQIFNNIIDQTGNSSGGQQGIGIFAVPSSTFTISNVKILNNWVCGGWGNTSYAIRATIGSGTSCNNLFIQGNTLTSVDYANCYGVSLDTISNYWILNNDFYGTGSNPFTNPLVITNSTGGTSFANKNLYTTNNNVDFSTVLGQFTVSNATAANLIVSSGTASAVLGVASGGAGIVGTSTNQDFYFQANGSILAAARASGSFSIVSGVPFQLGNAATTATKTATGKYVSLVDSTGATVYIPTFA